MQLAFDIGMDHDWPETAVDMQREIDNLYLDIASVWAVRQASYWHGVAASVAADSVAAVVVFCTYHFDYQLATVENALKFVEPYDFGRSMVASAVASAVADALVCAFAADKELPAHFDDLALDNWHNCCIRVTDFGRNNSNDC